MTAEHYLREKERLSQALNGQDRLEEAMEDITEASSKFSLDKMPGVALDVTVFTLETLHLGRLNLQDRQP